MKSSFTELLQKYDVPVPRYTSYPTVPAWTTTPTSEEWHSEIRTTLNQPNSSWSMYIHIPFCETMCTFCGCNTIITKDHKREAGYLQLLLKEWSLYLQQNPELKTKPFKHIHLGGGSPTFLSPESLKYLLETIFQDVTKSVDDFEASIEVDPRRTTYDQLKVLRELGFNRISLGVQDFNEEVQALINRKQPFSITKKITDDSRALGYESVNFDLIYGLPRQDLDMIHRTLDQTLELRPDRIAFYSFALVPWIKPAQRLFSDEDLPSSEKKRELYEVARERFLKAGYLEVGMDHFALPTDNLFRSRESGELHRNFMGYTDKKTNLLLGLGVSSISESKNMFHQNEKLLPKYTEDLEKNSTPTHRGHILTEKDLKNKVKILKVMTQFQLDFDSEAEYLKIKDKAQDFIQQGLVTVDEKKIQVLKDGQPFLRNICALFDEHFQQTQTQNQNQKMYSKSI